MAYQFIYGISPVLQVLLEKRRKPLKILIHRSQKTADLKKILHLARKEGVPVDEVDKHQLSQTTQTTQHQGIALQVDEYCYGDFEVLLRLLSKKSEGLVLVLDQIQDPQNLGAILRSAVCAGVDAAILPEKGSALVTPAVLKASAGAAEAILVAPVVNLVRALSELKKLGFKVVGTEAGAPLAFWEADLGGKVALVLGSEGMGVRNVIKKQCDFLISIPLLGTISALNVSVTAGILLYEVLRQRKNLKTP